MKISKGFSRHTGEEAPAPVIYYEEGDCEFAIFAPAIGHFQCIAYFAPDDLVLFDESFDKMGQAIDRFAEFLKAEHPD